MRERLIFAGQLLFTLLIAAFLIVPAFLSMLAGVTANYFRGIASGFTLQWVIQVWDLRHLRQELGARGLNWQALP